MAGRVWEDPRQQAAQQQQATATWERIRQIRANPNAPQDARRVSDLSANYPHLRPGVAVPLARAGVAPTDPRVQQVATAEAKRNRRNRGFWGAIGDLIPSPNLVGPLAGLAPAGVGALNAVGNVGLTSLKGATRWGTAALSAPYEAATGLWRSAVGATGSEELAGASAGAAVGGQRGNVIGAVVGGVLGAVSGASARMQGREIESQGFVNPLAQTTIGQAVSRGTESVGSGYFVGGEARTATVRSQREAAALAGHALTPGRMLAAGVTEPGTRPYDLLSGVLDASAAWRLDPTAAAAKRWSKVRAAQRLFDPATLKREAGLVDGLRTTVLPEVADRWLAGSQGSRATQWLADTTDFETIRQQLGRGKVDVRVVRDLADARTPEEVANILRPRLGVDPGLVEKPRVGSMGMEVRRKARPDWRLLNDLPSGRLDFNDPTEAVDQFHLLLKDAKIPAAQANAATRKMADALLSQTPEGKLQARKLVRDEFLGGLGGKLDVEGVAANELRKLSAKIAKDEELIYRSFVAEDGTQTAVRAVSWGGKSQGLPNSGFLADHLDGGLEFDRTLIRDVRATTSRLAPIFANKRVKVGVSAGEYLTNEVWKPLALLRGAWTVRVIGEEQVRMAASGRTSIFNHPLSYLSWMLDEADPNVWNAFLKRIPGVTPGRGAVGVTGERFAPEGGKGLVAADDVEAELRGRADDYAAALGIRQQADGWHRGGTLVRAKHTATFTRGDEGYAQAHSELIDKLHSDPVIRSIAERGLEDTRMALSHPDGDLAGLRTDLVAKGALLERSADVDAHLANAHRNLTEAAGGTHVPQGQQLGLEGVAGVSDPVLLDAVRTGTFQGMPIRTPRGELNKEFVAALARYEGGPAQIVGTAFEVPGNRFLAAKDQAVTNWFAALMAKPSARFSRSPTFRQAYWEEADNLIYQTDAAGQAKLLESAREAKLPREQIKRLEERAKLGQGDLTLEHVDKLAQGRALDATRELLYDVANRGQLSDVLRILYPFLEAQKEVMGTWARLGTQRPQALRRGQQLIQGARGAGWFYTDEQTGDEMFSFPGSDLLTDALIGMPIPLAGRVQGLNMFGSGILPGVGPVVQIAARWILPDKPEWDEVRKFLDPFGAGAGEREGLLESFLPGYATKLITAFSAPDSDRVFANSVKDVWAAGVSAGRYSTEDPESIKDGLEDAKQKARILYALRGLATLGGAPTALSPRMMAQDKEGVWLVAQKLSEDLRTMQDEDFETAATKFIDKYGNNAFAYLQAKSYGTTAAAPTTEDAADWLKGHQDVAERYPDVAGLFAPSEGEFSYTQYLRNLKSGATVSLTPEQYARSANNKLGQMVYYAQKERFGPYPSKPQREWLASLRVALREKYPGYDEALPGKPDRETVTKEFIPQIEKAVADPALGDNDVAQATRVYLAARRQATASAQAAGYQGFAQARDAEVLRDWLRQVGQKLTEQVPAFGDMFERVFDREMESDVPTTTAAPT